MPARQKALGIIDAELAEKTKKALAAKDCPAARPLCPIPKDALLALKDGLGPDVR